MFLAFMGFGILFVWAYLLFIREWLVLQWPDRFTWWHTLEDQLWLNSRQILVARMYWLAGIAIAIHEGLAASGFDITPFLTQVANYVPEKWRPFYEPLVVPLFLALTGWAIGWLRRVTTEPLLIPGDTNASNNLLPDRDGSHQ